MTVVTRRPETETLKSASERIWHELEKASFAIVSYVTPAGAPRSSGVVYTVVERHMYIAVDSDSWKARHIAIDGQAAVTVLIRRGGSPLLVPMCAYWSSASCSALA